MITIRKSGWGKVTSMHYLTAINMCRNKCWYLYAIAYKRRQYNYKRIDLF